MSFQVEWNKPTEGEELQEYRDQTQEELAAFVTRQASALAELKAARPQDYQALLDLFKYMEGAITRAALDGVELTPYAIAYVQGKRDAVRAIRANLTNIPIQAANLLEHAESELKASIEEAKGLGEIQVASGGGQFPS